MKVSKKAIHIICGVFECIFSLLELLAIIYVAYCARVGEPLIIILLFTFLILLPLSLLAATIVIHVLAVKPVRTDEQIAAKRQAQKQKRIEQLQAKLDNLKEDGE